MNDTMPVPCSSPLSRPRIPALLLTAALVPAAALGNDGYATTYTPAATGEIRIECVCLVPTATHLQCTGLRVLDDAAGRPRHTWPQTIHGQKGKALDLSAACHRKREVDALGAGLCCDAQGADIQRLFAAKVLTK